MRKLNLSNEAGRNAAVLSAPVVPRVKGSQGVHGEPTQFKRYLVASNELSLEFLNEAIAPDLANALIEGDPEIDMEHVGRFIDSTRVMLTTAAGEPMYATPHFVEITLDPAGVEVSRAEPVDTSPTVTDDIPLSWTGRKMPRAEVVRQFVFRRSLQLCQVDGVTFDFLYAMAKDLHESDTMMLMGAGANGKDPIILQVNGNAYRGFLEGRIDGDAFILLLHLSNMELKAPAEKAGE